MPREKKAVDKKAILSVVIPAIIAVLVVVALAVSGHITKKNDVIHPTDVSKPSVTEEVTEPENTDAKVTLIAVGDNLIHNTCISSGEQEDGSLNYDSFYEDTKSYISGADLAIINQETILGGPDFEYTGYPIFNSPYEVGEAAINAGFDVFTCATNHSMDKGFAGITNEVNFFKKHSEVTAVGTYTSEADYNTIAYVERNGLKFAMLNYTYGTNGIPLPDDKQYCVSLLEKDRVKAQIEEARKNADVVVVLPHWGTENSHDVNDHQREFVQMFSDLGVDIVIGGHPHVLQPVEWVTNETTGKKMIVYYSLGNFVSHQINLNQMCGGMAEITVERKNGEIEITSAKLAPTIDFYTNTGAGYKFRVFKFKDYNNDFAAQQAQQGATVEYFEGLAKDVVSEEFLDLN